MEEIRQGATLTDKLTSAKNRVANAKANLKRTIEGKEKKARDDMKQKINEIRAILLGEIKNQENAFIKEMEEALDPFISELISQLNYYGSLSLLDQKKYDKFLELITLINDSHPYITEICSSDVTSNLLVNKWAKVKRTAEALHNHFNNEEKFYGRGFKPNIEFTDTTHVPATHISSSIS